jgi:hypothetical protein
MEMARERGLLQRLHQQWYSALFRRQLARLPCRTVDGLALYFPEGELERVEAALGLLREVDRVRHRRLRRHLAILTTSRVGTHFDATARAICIDVQAEGGTWMLGAALVHEATHAYLLETRHVPYQGRWREWHERVCMREEVRFLSRALRYAGWDGPAAQEYLSRVEAHHERALAAQWWEQPLLVPVRSALWRRQAQRAAS